MADPMLAELGFRISDPVERRRHALREREIIALERIADALEAQVAAASFLDDALQPGTDESDPPNPDTLDFYRTTEGAFRVRTPNGDREPTPAEAALLRSTVKRREPRGR